MFRQDIVRKLPNGEKEDGVKKAAEVCPVASIFSF
jgi:hypothetical protein